MFEVTLEFGDESAAAITWARERYNATAETPIADNAEYVGFVMRGAVDSYANQKRQDEIRQLGELAVQNAVERKIEDVT